jgi:thioredoxin reductase (NADPH)
MYGVPGHPDIKACDFVSLLSKQCLEFASDVFFGSCVYRVTRLNDGLFKIDFANMSAFAKYIIIATGVGSMVYNIPSDIDGLTEIKSNFIQGYCTDLHLYEGKDVVVSGGGDSAVDLATLISTVAKRVTVVHRRDLTCEPSKLEKLYGAQRRVSVILDRKIVKLKEESGKVRTIIMRNTKSGNTEEIKTDHLVFCYGFTTRKRNFFGLENEGLRMENSLIGVDFATMSTSMKDCYAAGDVIAYPYKEKNVVSCFFEAGACVRAIKGKIKLARSGS